MDIALLNSGTIEDTIEDSMIVEVVVVDRIIVVVVAFDAHEG